MDFTNYSTRSLLSKHDWVIIPLFIWVGFGVYLAILDPHYFFGSDFNGSTPWFSSILLASFFLLLAAFVVLYFVRLFRRRPMGIVARGVAYFFAIGALAIIGFVLLGAVQSCPSLGGGEEPCMVWIILMFALLLFNSASLLLMIGLLIAGIVSLAKSLTMKL